MSENDEGWKAEVRAALEKAPMGSFVLMIPGSELQLVGPDEAKEIMSAVKDLSPDVIQEHGAMALELLKKAEPEIDLANEIYSPPKSRFYNVQSTHFEEKSRELGVESEPELIGPIHDENTVFGSPSNYIGSVEKESHEMWQVVKDRHNSIPRGGKVIVISPEASGMNDSVKAFREADIVIMGPMPIPVMENMSADGIISGDVARDIGIREPKDPGLKKTFDEFVKLPPPPGKPRDKFSKGAQWTIRDPELIKRGVSQGDMATITGSSENFVTFMVGAFGRGCNKKDFEKGANFIGFDPLEGVTMNELGERVLAPRAGTGDKKTFKADKYAFVFPELLQAWSAHKVTDESQREFSQSFFYAGVDAIKGVSKAIASNLDEALKEMGHYLPPDARTYLHTAWQEGMRDAYNRGTRGESLEGPKNPG